MNEIPVHQSEIDGKSNTAGNNAKNICVSKELMLGVST